MRQYQPIWEQIRTHKKAKLIAPSDKHRRIIQAVRKEKCKDEGFKLLCAEASKTFKLVETVDAEKGIIEFTLIDVSGISITDL